MPINDMLTISDAAKALGVSRQRMHVLIKTYAVQTTSVGPIKLVDLKELRKIPAIRPTGKKVS
jgi:hypothetical protein